MNPANPKEVKSLLESEGFEFKKSLGQNFLIDDSICPKMAIAACKENGGVLEIGPGAGVLTGQLARLSKKVVAIEIDTRLEGVLKKTLGAYANVKIIFGDVLKLDLKRIIKEEFSECDSISVCANLPYYITSPVIMMLLESDLGIDSITVMVQKEAADRICAEVGTRTAGAVTVAVNYYAKAKKLFDVSRGCFLPSPNVDSAVIGLEMRGRPPIAIKDEKRFFSFVKACFAQRRKTLINTVSNTLGIEKPLIRDALFDMGLSETVRSEQLNMQQMGELCDKIFSE